jgi:hypothetical protein
MIYTKEIIELIKSEKVYYEGYNKGLDRAIDLILKEDYKQSSRAKDQTLPHCITENHLIYTQKGWKRAKDITNDSILLKKDLFL